MTAGDETVGPRRRLASGPRPDRRDHPVTINRCNLHWGECDQFPGFAHICRLTPPDHPQPHRCVCGEQHLS